MVSTLSCWADSMNEHVFTINTSACAVSLVTSTPSFNSVPTITSASTRFFAQPSEIMPTRTGRSLEFSFIKDRTHYATDTAGATLRLGQERNRAHLGNATTRQQRKPPACVVPTSLWLVGPN